MRIVERTKNKMEDKDRVHAYSMAIGSVMSRIMAETNADSMKYTVEITKEGTTQKYKVEVLVKKAGKAKKGKNVGISKSI